MTAAPRTERFQSPAPPRPMNTFVGSGVLWAINKHLLHPRGFALVIAVDDANEPIGWDIAGDGTGPWMFDSDEPHATLFRELIESLAGEVA